MGRASSRRRAACLHSANLQGLRRHRHERLVRPRASLPRRRDEPAPRPQRRQEQSAARAAPSGSGGGGCRGEPSISRIHPGECQIINHSGARVVCAHADYLATVDGIRYQIPHVERFVALEGSAQGWLGYEDLIAGSGPDFERPEIAEGDLLTINYTSGTTSRPKGVMITHRG
jgi:hypothetical protein